MSILLLLLSCEPTQEKKVNAENELDAARLFIRAALDGKFDEAKDYMVQDSVNTSYLDIAAQFYQKIPGADRDSYKGSTIGP